MQCAVKAGLPKGLQHGLDLPSAHELIRQLGALSRALNTGGKDCEAANLIEAEICGMANGLYEGYISDLDAVVCSVNVLRITRGAREGANVHTFVIELAVLDNGYGKMGGTVTLELRDFLSQVNRSLPFSESQIVGPRFWPR